jgi:hypothetical protein
MGVGKYSPTVTAAYAADQDWHDKLCDDGEWIDRDGYDSYGYHRDSGKDRAGYTELDYMASGQWDDDLSDFVYPLDDDVSRDWTFDGIRPVRR